MRVAFMLVGLLLCLPLSAAEKLNVVTSFSILADMAYQVGGEHIQVINLVGADQDAHLYNPTAEDINKVRKADLIIQNGLGFEPWMESLIARSGSKKPLITASAGVTPRMLDIDGSSVIDPHAWQSLADAGLYVNTIVMAFSAADPKNEGAYISGGRTLAKQLHALRADAHLKIGVIPTGTLPPGSRRFVISHNAFGYLSASYQIEFVPLSGLSSEVDIAPAHTTALTEAIQQGKAQAVLLDNTDDPRHLQKIASDNDLPVRGMMYSEALAAKGPASTFVGMYQTNINTLHDALATP